MNNEILKAARKQQGGFFKARREEMGRDLETVAQFIGISVNTLHGIETGRFDWGIDLQNCLCAALEIKPYFTFTTPDDHDGVDYRTLGKDDPNRYYGFLLADNLLLQPDEVTIIKLSNPRVSVRFNYKNAFFANYQDWIANHTDVQWLDPNDKPTTDDEVDEVLTDCWNFLLLQEAEEDRLYDNN